MKEFKNLFILRHGIAAEPGTRGYSDSERPLTQEGISEMKLIARGMKRLGLEFELVLSSPYVRARQTAEIAAGEFGLKNEIKFSDALRSEADPCVLLEELKQKYPEKDSVLLVGHQPFLTYLISLLTAGNKESSLELKKGGLCKLGDCLLGSRQASAVLKWLMTPKQLKLLADPAH